MKKSINKELQNKNYRINKELQNNSTRIKE